MTTLAQILALDQTVNSNTAFLQHPILTKLMIVITTLFSPELLLLFSALLFGYFWHKKQKDNAILLAILMLSGSALILLLKYIIQRARPENMLLSETGYSFPSGHTAIATVFFCFVIYTFYEKIENRLLQYLFFLGNIFMILAVGFSRIYLQVHWLSDVVFGFLLGLGLFTTVFFSLKHLKKASPQTEDQ